MHIDFTMFGMIALMLVLTTFCFCPCKAAVCLRTVKPATMEHGKPMTTSLSMESIVQSVAEAGVEGTVEVSWIVVMQY